MEPKVAQTRMNRRKAVQLATVAGGAVVLGGGVVSMAIAANQVDSTPPAPPAPTFNAPSDPIFDLAVRLNYDQQAILDFVRDEIHYETYAGVLRGAKGTLWARAGNSADQAVLLASLLEASQIAYRFAIGPLATDAEATLISELTPTLERVNAGYREALIAANLAVLGLEEIPSTPEAVSVEDQAALDSSLLTASTVIAAGALATTAAQATIQQALATAAIELPSEATVTLADRERLWHAWVQVADGPSWLDLDPSLPADMIATVAETTFENFPDDWYHQIMVRLAADEISYGSLTRRDVVTLTTTSQRVVDVPIAINLAPAEAIAGLGNSINMLLGGQLTIIPSIFADGTSVDGTQPLMFGTDAANANDVLASGTPTVGASEGETVAVWLLVDIVSPDTTPVSIERAILDRVPVLDRASGIIDPATIAPIRSEPSAFEQDSLNTVAEFNRFFAVYVDVGRIPNIYALSRAQTDLTVGSIHAFGPSLASTRDGLGITHETEAGIWSYPSSPNITAFTFTPSASQDGTSQGSMAIDIIYRQRTSHPISNAPQTEAINPLVLSGILDAVAEQILVSPEMLGAVAEATYISIGSVFSTAEAEGVPVAVVADIDDLAGIELGDSARLQIEASLTLGNVVIVPEQPVDIAGQLVSAWWIVDPVSGRTSDLLDNGTGGATGDIVIGPGGEARYGDTLPFYARWLAWLKKNAQTLNCVGTVVGAIVGVATFIISFNQNPILAALGAAGAGSNFYKIPNACL